MSFDSGVKMLGKWVVDNANQWFLLVREGQRDGDVGMSVDKIGSTVNRIHDKGRSVCQTAGLSSFLTKEAVAWVLAGRYRNASCGEIHE